MTRLHCICRNGAAALAVTRSSDVSKSSMPYEDIDCVINGEYTVGCRREGHDVYLPFSFISKYFEVIFQL